MRAAIPSLSVWTTSWLRPGSTRRVPAAAPDPGTAPRVTASAMPATRTTAGGAGHPLAVARDALRVGGGDALKGRPGSGTRRGRRDQGPRQRVRPAVDRGSGPAVGHGGGRRALGDGRALGAGDRLGAQHGPEDVMVVVQLAEEVTRPVVDVGAAPGAGLEPAHVPAVPVIDLTVLDEAPVGPVPAE